MTASSVLGSVEFISPALLNILIARNGITTLTHDNCSDLLRGVEHVVEDVLHDRVERPEDVSEWGGRGPDEKAQAQQAVLAALLQGQPAQLASCACACTVRYRYRDLCLYASVSDPDPA